VAKIDYKALLEEWKRQRAELDTMIAFAERQLGVAPSAGNKTVPLAGTSPEIEEDTFHGKNILQGSEMYLQMVGRPARSTEEIAAALTKGGLTAGAPSVATILGREKNGNIQRVKRGLWGLREWY
jgi:hypothetical protein